ncbi:hypothetical protein DMH04_41420 [Kibdelosporangium aridum]|uniref:Uncharacterized protein n=1 Tax=Kibdelosporangium aridum TaxID=2030 RepID=A0A428YUU5_KIBAR|nr:hypothetical protein [Kibdelosporangium aridum]RSM73474.1 hypothetical protein DMH04_41420 [Kibdelosporangium aridum]
MTDVPRSDGTVMPMVPVSAELLYQLSIAAGGMAFAVLGRMTVGGPHAEARADHYHQLGDQVEAVLTEHCPGWLERRADQDLTGGGHG